MSQERKNHASVHIDKGRGLLINTLDSCFTLEAFKLIYYSSLLIHHPCHCLGIEGWPFLWIFLVCLPLTLQVLSSSSVKIILATPLRASPNEVVEVITLSAIFWSTDSSVHVSCSCWNVHVAFISLQVFDQKHLLNMCVWGKWSINGVFQHACILTCTYPWHGPHWCSSCKTRKIPSASFSFS